jgi:hypothetical protein
MRKYKVEMIIEVTDYAGHPRKWIPESIAEQLNDGEDILEWNIEETEAEARASLVAKPLCSWLVVVELEDDDCVAKAFEQAFQCDAEDVAHAIEQAEDAYPGSTVIKASLVHPRCSKCHTVETMTAEDTLCEACDELEI